VDVTEWLKSLGLEKYAQAFQDNDVDAKVLASLTGDDLKDIGVNSVGHRRRLLEAIEKLTEKSETVISQAEPPSEALSAPSPPEGHFNPPAPPNVSRAERRQLTVLFCDLVGSTELAKRLDPEEYRELLGIYTRAATLIVGRFEGFIAKYMGDGVLAYFGYPQAHEDEAGRAVRTGLALAEEIARLRAPGTASTLKVRVGIATGLTVVGDLIGAGSAEEQSVAGETPNLAARLQGLAPPGGVIIANATRRLIGDEFELEDLGPQTLKDYPEQVATWRVIGERRTDSRFEARTSGQTPLIGREQEIALLLDRWQQVRDGEGQVVLLSGEPGIGKSRITRAFQDRIEREPYIRLRHQCSPYHASSTLHPTIEHLERAARFERDDSPADKLRKLEILLAQATDNVSEATALIASLLSIPTEGNYPQLSLSPQRQKERTIDILIEQVMGLARAQPLLCLFEDMHWADPTTLELMDEFIGRIPAERVLLLLTFRPNFVPHWGGRPHVTQISLNRLARRQSAAMVEKVTVGKSLPAEVLDQIVAKTDGVPLFVEELTKTVLEAGFLEEEDDRYVLKGPLPPLAIPATLQDSLMARLDRLAPVKEVAQMGAAIGREFSYELLAAVSPLPEPDLLEALRQLVDAELVFSKGRPPEVAYTFKHALVQDTAYGSLLKSRRQQLHARIAQAIETKFPKIARKEPNVLAHHFGQAGLLDKAIAYHEQAGRGALARSALAEALTQFSSALEQLAMLPRSEERLNRELSIHLAMGSAHVAASGFAAPATGEAYKRSAEICEELSNTRQLFPVLYGLCLYHLYGAELAEAATVADRLMKLAQPGDDRDLAFFANRAVGVSALPAGNFAKARDHLDRALTVYDPQEHKAPAFVYAFDPRVVCLDYLARALLPLGFPEQAIAANDEAILEARRSQHQNSLALPLFFGGVLHQMLDHQTAVEERCQELAKIAADAGFRFWHAGATILQGWVTADRGELDAGGEAIDKGIEEWRATGANYMLPYFLALQAEVANKASRRDRALHLLEKAENRVERTGERWFLAEIQRLKGETLAKVGTSRLADAKASLLQALETAKTQEARFWEMRAALSLARLAPNDLAAQQRLARCLAALTEGFKLKDAVTARTFLEKGTQAPNLKLVSS